jgi:hypothetical protein
MNDPGLGTHHYIEGFFATTSGSYKKYHFRGNRVFGCIWLLFIKRLAEFTGGDDDDRGTLTLYRAAGAELPNFSEIARRAASNRVHSSPSWRGGIVTSSSWQMTVNSSTAIALSHYLSVKAIIAPWEAEEMWVPIL